MLRPVLSVARRNADPVGLWIDLCHHLHLLPRPLLGHDLYAPHHANPHIQLGKVRPPATGRFPLCLTHKLSVISLGSKSLSQSNGGSSLSPPVSRQPRTASSNIAISLHERDANTSQFSTMAIPALAIIRLESLLEGNKSEEETDELNLPAGGAARGVRWREGKDGFEENHKGSTL
jgi:hypothetical protein